MSRRGWWITLAATAAMTLSYLDRQALSALAPTITADLKLTNTQYGWLGSAFSVAYLLAGPLAARWCDRLGAKRALLYGVIAWSAAAAAHSLAVGFFSFLALRLALGAVEAPSLPAGAQTVQAVLAPADRARGMALLFAGMSVGSALAPPIAIGIGAWINWRASFIGLALIAVAWIPLWQLVTRRGGLPHVPRAERADWRAVLKKPMMLRGLVGLAAIIPVSTFTLQWGAKFFAAHHVGKAAYATYLLASGIAYDVERSRSATSRHGAHTAAATTARRRGFCSASRRRSRPWVSRAWPCSTARRPWSARSSRCRSAAAATPL